MEIKKLLERYAYYYEFLQKLGNFPLSATPTLEALQPSRGVVQAGYKEIKSINFDGNLIDYLCLISTEYIVSEVKKFLGPKVSFGGACQYIVKEIYKRDHANVNNLLRLAMKNPVYLYDLIGEKKKDSKAIADKSVGFEELFELWLNKYLTKEIQPSQ